METQYGIEFQRSKKEITASRARLDSVQIVLHRRNTEVQNELDASQKHVLNLSATVEELSEYYRMSFYWLFNSVMC